MCSSSKVALACQSRQVLLGGTGVRTGIAKFGSKLVACWAWVVHLLLLLVLLVPFHPHLVLAATGPRRRLVVYCRGMADFNPWA